MKALNSPLGLGTIQFLGHKVQPPSEEEEAECLILKDTSDEAAADSIYEIVEDDVELSAVLKVFEELLEDVDIEM